MLKVKLFILAITGKTCRKRWGEAKGAQIANEMLGMVKAMGAPLDLLQCQK